jgi:hypothetical protein
MVPKYAPDGLRILNIYFNSQIPFQIYGLIYVQQSIHSS